MAKDEDEEEEGMDPAMAAMMGFGGFQTTKVSDRELLYVSCEAESILIS